MDNRARDYQTELDRASRLAVEASRHLEHDAVVARFVFISGEQCPRRVLRGIEAHPGRMRRADHLLGERHHAVEAQHFWIGVDGSRTDDEKLTKRRDAEMIAVLR